MARPPIPGRRPRRRKSLYGLPSARATRRDTARHSVPTVRSEHPSPPARAQGPHDEHSSGLIRCRRSADSDSPSLDAAQRLSETCRQRSRRAAPGRNQIHVTSPDLLMITAPRNSTGAGRRACSPAASSKRGACVVTAAPLIQLRTTFVNPSLLISPEFVCAQAAASKRTARLSVAPAWVSSSRDPQRLDVARRLRRRCGPARSLAHAPANDLMQFSRSGTDHSQGPQAPTPSIRASSSDTLGTARPSVHTQTARPHQVRYKSLPQLDLLFPDRSQRRDSGRNRKTPLFGHSARAPPPRSTSGFHQGRIPTMGRPSRAGTGRAHTLFHSAEVMSGCDSTASPGMFNRNCRKVLAARSDSQAPPGVPALEPAAKVRIYLAAWVYPQDLIKVSPAVCISLQ